MSKGQEPVNPNNANSLPASDIKGTISVTALKAMGNLPLWLNQRVGTTLGKLLWLGQTDTRRISQINIDLCFPDADADWRQNLARKSVINTAITACEMGAVWTKPVQATVDKIVAIEGKQLIDQALKNSSGVIIIAPHLGNWEILGNYLSKFYPLTNMYLPPDQKKLGELIYQARIRSGSKLAPANRRGVVQIVKALRNGEVTGILPDQVPKTGAGSAYAPFFGIQAQTSTIVPRLLSEGYAVAFGGFCLRTKKGYKVIFREVEPEIYSSDPATSLAAMNKSIENYIKECPEQYQWEYKRFRRRPKGEEEFYNPGRIA